MNHRPATRAKLSLREAEDSRIRQVAPADRRNALLNFQYSYTEISSSGAAARVKSRSVRYEDGKLSDESFEGEMDHSVYQRAVDQAQRLFLAQADMLIRSFASMLSLWHPQRPQQDR